MLHAAQAAHNWLLQVAAQAAETLSWLLQAAQALGPCSVHLKQQEALASRAAELCTTHISPSQRVATNVQTVQQAGNSIKTEKKKQKSKAANQHSALSCSLNSPFALGSVTPRNFCLMLLGAINKREDQQAGHLICRSCLKKATMEYLKIDISGRQGTISQRALRG